ncbi:MAG: enoyl-CoA hydratase/isomerase family protein [Rhodoferax sp.]
MVMDGSSPLIETEVRGCVGCITLNRPAALNALSLDMVHALTECLQRWQRDDAVQAVAFRGRHKTQGNFHSFCAGGDIRYFHRALLTGDPSVEDFFTEEYRLNHLIHTYPKPTVAFMDGVCMGGGMGIAQGARWRLVTERSQLAMPETLIGLFPDVGGGYFLSRCPGAVGEWLALTGTTLGPGAACEANLADAVLPCAALPAAWDALAGLVRADATELKAWIASFSGASTADSISARAKIDAYFSGPSAGAIARHLEADPDPWAQHTARLLRQRSPLMQEVSLRQIRTERTMRLGDALRQERGLMRHCFYPAHLARSATQTEAFEGIRARVIDKDNAPQWQPAYLEAVDEAMIAPFFISPWPHWAHPLRDLID